MFALFEAETVTRFGVIHFIEGPMKRLVSGIPDKIKFVMGSRIPISIPESSESLMVIVPNEYTLYESLMLDILNKRWQTLDLISMMEEFKRSANEEFNKRRYKHTWSGPSITAFSEDLKTVSVKDSLSSRPRFTKEKELTEFA